MSEFHIKSIIILDIARPGGAGVDPGAVAELRAALLRHEVVFLRGQQHASDADQRAFAQLLGPLTRPHPTVAGDGTAVLPIDSERGKANSWHTDVTFVDRVPAISVLRAITLPPYGGSTVWANTAEAYRRLHPALRALAGQLRAVHTNLYEYAAGRPQIGGMDVKEEEYLLQRHITRLENTVRWTWRDGDIAIWDNRATQHYAVADYDDLPRRLYRVTVAGDIPVGINGDTSVVRKGDASHYAPLAA